ncbi:2-oxoacid:ferredoxin oxidoreductase subunit gamma [Anoxybacter fermentans]|uniref:2-oxoacid:ferredoxin oxidoreductase subunit gamma n=1 Tax=Anoxybacter fermentans TaxID=1323375 RepID=A0A3S9SYV1_9FIRM|nr:2-oxoacid:acceptor oxidoreductase family protein [Anoxybacter fermentans]AZR73440.1 2-oxoacid:ferredoxin oxidoreductase subunit gamma [Anoxybacter fermentans]
MKQEIIMAGFGGQGIMAMGRLLAYTGMMEGKEVSWMPSYGPEMRGGTANCTVIVSDKRIASPITTTPDVCIVMNLPSLEKFAPMVKPGGLLIINSSLIEKECERTDIEILKVPCNDIANELGSSKVLNMVALGAYIQKTKILPFESVIKAMKKAFAGKEKFIPLNEAALKKGAELVK